MKKTMFLLMTLFFSHLVFAGGEVEELLAQARKRASSQTGAHARNELVHRLLRGQINEDILTLETATKLLNQVIKTHGANTQLGARARVLLSASRISDLIGDDAVTFEQLVGYLNNVLDAFGPETREGAAARNNLGFMRVHDQVDNELLTIDDTRRYLTEVLDVLPADVEGNEEILANARAHLERLPAEQQTEPKRAKVDEAAVENTVAHHNQENPVDGLATVVPQPPPLPIPVFDFQIPDQQAVRDAVPEMFRGFNAIMPFLCLGAFGNSNN